MSSLRDAVTPDASEELTSDFSHPTSRELPAWLQAEYRPASVPAGRRGSFLAGTVARITDVVREDFLADRRADAAGLLQGIDPRVKVGAVVALIASAVTLESLGFLVLFYVFVLGLALASRIPPALVLTRAWPVALFFGGFVALPLMLSWYTPGTAVVTVWGPSHPVALGPLALPDELYLSAEGINRVLVTVLRVAACTTLALLLPMTTKWGHLFRALRALFVPQTIVMLLEMSLRYLFLLLQNVLDLVTARESRAINPAALPERRRFAVRSIATLLSRSLTLSDEVYQALKARGYSGEPRTLEDFRLGWRDGAFALVAGLAVFLLVGGEAFVR
ncbi:cobalt ECF transporter T component CbiQ [Desulforudis sp. 1088]|uniref:cobalt ECF transporter T component CbiQ n=1 Tax=unclassified Candidatus Desulforudis TaxID=2635950 RepID=UPI00347D0D6E